MTVGVISPPDYVVRSEESYDNKVNKESVRRLVNLFKPYRWHLLMSMFLMLVTSAASVAGPYLVKIAIDSGINAGDMVVLRYTILIYLAAAMAQWLGTYFRVNMMAWVGQSVIYDLRMKLFVHLQNLSLGFFSRYSVGRVITRVINDSETLRDFLTWALLAIARDIFTLALIIVMMLDMNFQLALISFSVLPLMTILTIILRRASRSAYRKVRAAVSWVNSVLAENVNGVRVVQAFSRQKANYSHFRDYVNRYHLQKSIATARVSSLFSPGVEILGAIATSLVVWIGGTAVLGNTITAGVLVAFILYIDRFFEPIRDLSRRYDTLQSTLIGWERLIHLLDTPIEVKDSENAAQLPIIKGDVKFENVSFHYSDDPTPILSNIDLVVSGGETVAFVGQTGAGKTTLIKLLSRFHDPTEGRILVDGFDIRTITQMSLRSQMGVVLQDPFLFNGTVAENIRFGRLEADDAEIQDVALAVGAHDFIMKLRHGYETSVEEGGVMLSVGQRQLLSFARALLADPKILILDEATSSVDTQTERLIQKALHRLLRGRTSFVIAHRLSTIIGADRIIVIKDGRIAEQGKHADLLDLRGDYYQLYKMGFTENGNAE